MPTLTEFRNSLQLIADTCIAERARLSQIDTDITNLQHILEDLKLSAVELTTVAVQLREKLQLRRDVKEYVNTLNNITSEKRTLEGMVQILANAETKQATRSQEYMEQSKIGYARLFKRPYTRK